MSDQLLTDELFHVGNIVQIEFRDEFQKKIVSKTRVVKSEPDSLELLLPADFPIPVKAGLKIMITCHISPRNYYFNSKVMRSKANPPSLVITRPAVIQAVSRRSFFRCEVELTLTYLSKKDEPKIGIVFNLSASGLFAHIKQDHLLKVGAVIEGEITLPTQPETLNFKAKVTRLEKIDNEAQGVALSFQTIDEKFENVIIKYLFQRQRELIKLGHIKAGKIF